MSAGRERERVRESALIRFMTLTAHWNRPSSSNAVERTEKWTPSDSDSAWTPSRAWSFISVRRTPDKPFDLFSLPKTERIFNIFMTHISRCHLPLSLSLSLTLSLCRLWVTTRLSEAREIYAFLRLCKPWFFHPQKSIIKFMVFSPWDFSLAAAFLLLLIPTSESNKCISYLVYGICLVYLVLCSISFFFFFCLSHLRSLICL